MMKNKKLFTFLISLPLFLASCVMNNGICENHVDKNKDNICDNCGKTLSTTQECSHVDVNKDGYCDLCSAKLSSEGPTNPCVTHHDHDLDGKCDDCGAEVAIPSHDHIDGNHDGKCDICSASMIVCTSHIDSNGDNICDNCGATMPTVQSDVTVYLVLSSVGLYKGNVGVSYDNMHIENAIQYIAKPGTALPGKNDVTHLYGSADFESWLCYEGSGAPTVYTTVPSVNNKILYANFVNNGNTPVTPQPDEPTPSGETQNFTLKTNFTDGNWSTDNPKIQVYCWDASNNNRLYTCTKVDDDTYSFTIAKGYTGCLFLRMSQTATFNPQNWDTSVIWNQTDDLALDYDKTTAQITSWSGGSQGHSTVAWIN